MPVVRVGMLCEMVVVVDELNKEDIIFIFFVGLSLDGLLCFFLNRMYSKDSSVDNELIVIQSIVEHIGEELKLKGFDFNDGISLHLFPL